MKPERWKFCYVFEAKYGHQAGKPLLLGTAYFISCGCIIIFS